MKRAIYFFILLFCYIPQYASATTIQSTVQQPQKNTDLVAKYVYEKAGLKGKLDFDVFKNGYHAYYNAQGRKKQLLTIIDYSKPSTEKRFFVVDLKTNRLLFHTYVTHGVNSGGVTAKHFSNIVNSRQTSLGTFLTDTTYYGGNGYSLRLDGLTKGMNDNARRRYIVVHGAPYATEDFIRRHGYLGRSWGCPALPKHLSKKIIDTIKGGSVIYARA
ncbi:murein L,D-transpeptidase catalytic domain family protein [Photobacterium sp. 1_MG-2023]|uniref:murein L,D-transpeptidase catalytic domain family protein n=1 Tax=Photobacterium sp. 1_MG-2023 TaxID=3062646 RepID=UPI0026E18447|nr:murein L,D-transpeptidase catalytic domain family protein [Photobacterium sp. 1_MG-2023]MDO6705565.1 murein L,D-transpeptidase catalytic domain family protein [Photobacterium sp. 1_MG-2023]